MTKVLRQVRDALDDGGLRGSFLVRDLDTADELALDAEIEFPIASLVKLPRTSPPTRRGGRPRPAPC